MPSIDDTDRLRNEEQRRRDREWNSVRKKVIGRNIERIDRCAEQKRLDQAHAPRHLTEQALAYLQAALRLAIDNGQPDHIVTGLASAMDLIEETLNTAWQKEST